MMISFYAVEKWENKTKRQVSSFQSPRTEDWQVVNRNIFLSLPFDVARLLSRALNATGDYQVCKGFVPESPQREAQPRKTENETFRPDMFSVLRDCPYRSI